MRLDRFMYDRKLTQQYGGYLQGQYWFTNQWYMTAIWAFNRNFGFDQRPLATAGRPDGHQPAGYKYATNNDQIEAVVGV